MQKKKSKLSNMPKEIKINKIKSEVIPACITPFDEHLNIDYASLRNVIQNFSESGIETIALAGTTGEGVTLTKEEKNSLIHFSKTHFPEIKVITCITDFRETDINYARNADCIMFTPQLFIKPSKESFFKYAEKICSFNENIILYNNPSRIGFDASEHYEELYRDFKNIIGIKECADFSEIAKYPKWKWFCGNDENYFACIKNKFNGIISSTANICPKIAVKLENEELWNNSAKQLFSIPNPAAIKLILKQRGIIKTSKMRFAIYEDSKEQEILNHKYGN
ncbi:dihydrodipicolinate synthase family protein [Candidatus Nesciobacter abundans]|uniref:Dihydrodipicolinate synthase family protein n=1 Tax=Candidatus Nesciobacter abundans TaxID=2601668 RepID=A0A5C0UI59_9PROT|nr:dihydrodipicolinate synthase family protein [Candidatus Nesciobacter abundans]QEK39271.1 dihydrodipicolinate synthase family protein [Candidatus Nesciobacter abundans]